MSVDSRGYKPHIARELLGLPEQTLRYWKDKLDPKPTRSHYSASILLAYRILKTLIENLRFSPSKLKHLQPNKIFEFCESCPLEDMKQYYLLISTEKGSIEVTSVDIKFNIRDYTLTPLYLNKVIDEHFLAFVSLGR